MSAGPSFWLVKSERGTYSYADLEREGGTVWDGVRNNAAALYLKAMRLGDRVMFYHSGDDKAVVGVAEVRREALPDATDPTGRFVAVELTPVMALPRPVTLAQMKVNRGLAEMVMLKQARLSVSPVSAAEWGLILSLATWRQAAQDA
ncbi:MAG TPA: EVE domain-containing protein [Caulobacteraceae bacterium]|nr:EVE domain-containing protein [Caulobacteraceae bacterium]